MQALMHGQMPLVSTLVRQLPQKLEREARRLANQREPVSLGHSSEPSHTPSGLSCERTNGASTTAADRRPRRMAIQTRSESTRMTATRIMNTQHTAASSRLLKISVFV